MLNVLYNIGIFLCAVFAFEFFQKAAYIYGMCAVFLGALLVILKIRLVRDVRNMQK